MTVTVTIGVTETVLGNGKVIHYGNGDRDGNGIGSGSRDGNGNGNSRYVVNGNGTYNGI